MNGGGVQEALGYRFADVSLLETALTHASFAAENVGAESYERLEFLGDAVLGLIATSIIYAEMEGEPEGQMTKIRASVVDEATLAEIAGRWHLGDDIRLGVGEDRSGGRQRASILSDVVESIIAAVFLDGGYGAAEGLITSVWGPIIARRVSSDEVGDSRSALQELLAKRGVPVAFTYDRTGPDHAAVFTAMVIVDGDPIGTGEGPSKKAAAIAAAEDALNRVV